MYTHRCAHTFPLITFCHLYSISRKEHSVWEEDIRRLQGFCQTTEAYSPFRAWISDKACVYPQSTRHHTLNICTYVCVCVRMGLASFVCSLQPVVFLFLPFHVLCPSSFTSVRTDRHSSIDWSCSVCALVCLCKDHIPQQPRTQCLACKPIPLNVSSLILILNLIHLLTTITPHIIPVLGPS